MPDLIIVTGELGETERDRARQAVGSHEVLFVPDLADVSAELGRAAVIVGPVGPDQLRAACSLRWVHSWIAGPNSQLSEEMRASDVILTSSAGNGGVPLAEHAMMMMLMLDRDAPRWLRAQEERRWDRHVHGELLGQTVGIIGLGNAGADLARKAKAFGMRTLAVRRRAEVQDPDVDQVFTPGNLHAMLRQSDFVVVTAPLTPQTRGMFGPDEFAAMPDHSFFVCISRGGIADDTALLNALRTGSIAGAGIDAHGVEPLPEESEFWDMPHVILTPHNGATTPGTRRRGVDIMLENLRRYRDGEPLLNVVDKAHGY
ncbi:D-2-hydroxyacid dehydrogenase [Ruania alba]|uniref:Phosphoglycerate dehydrogenase n=1 Tax=Ruania alba TaxID=648782 RepID=A0A1H5H7W6_9MICO|nr:D-2-hydroxyacid dehydrogenase [Ruania alba]SEE23338.1 Phosphoglycerate dehydrogenase [Ruania alba]